MNDKDMFHEDENSIDYRLWYHSYDPNFVDISFKSRIPKKWIEYFPVKNGEYSQSVIKPINRYVEKLYPHPELISITNNTVRLRQKTHAEIFLLINDRGGFRNVDRPWMRQYYKTKLEFEQDPECFWNFYKFYVPWFIDYEVGVRFEQVLDSPFKIYDCQDYYTKVGPAEFVEPKFVPFAFKKVGPHMLQENFGKVPRLSPMFDIVFEADDILIEEVRKFYAKN